MGEDKADMRTRIEALEKADRASSLAVKALASYVLTHGSCGREAHRLARDLGGVVGRGKTRQDALANLACECEQRRTEMSEALRYWAHVNGIPSEELPPPFVPEEET